MEVIIYLLTYVLSSSGFRGGQGGDSRGGGGYGGESFLHLVTGNSGKGGDISGASWTVNTNGFGGGGAGDTSGQCCSIYFPNGF